MRASRPSNRAARGFTLIEMIVVMLILAIIAGMVIPQVTGTNSMEARAAARMLMADLEYAQSQAIVTQTPITITFNLPANSYSVSNASGVLIHPITKNAYEVDFDEVAGMGSVSLASLNLGGAVSLTFDALGAPDRDGSVSVVAGPHTYVVSIAPVTGRVTVSEGP